MTSRDTIGAAAYKRLLMSTLVAAATLFAVTDTAMAQDYREGGMPYIKPRIGLDFYAGDRDLNSADELSRTIELRGLNGGIEIGYRFSPLFGLGVLGTYGHYPALDDATHPQVNPITGASDKRFTVHLVAPIHFATRKKISPYIVPGIGLMGGTVTDAVGSQIGLTPFIGAGLDFAVSRRVGIFAEADALFPRPDDKLDGVENGDNDIVGITSIGVRFNLKAPFVPVAILSAVGPNVLETDQNGTFEATVNADATQPTTYTWDFGDGTTATGMVATHTFAQPGTYTVTFTAMNGKGRAVDTRTMTVTVERPVVPPSIVSVTMDPQSPDTATPVSFNANVRGDGPFTYRWDFGDGTTATGPNPTHTYTQPGTYTVTLTTTNEGGTDTRTTTITVVPVEVDFCDTVVDLNGAFFGRNSSTLNEAARTALMDNVQILNDCPNMSVLVEGWAAPGERNGQRLSEARARAVEQFYIDNGIAASRISTAGRGTVSGVSRKEGTSQYRRADSLPINSN